MNTTLANLEESVTVSVRMPKGLSLALELQAASIGRTKSDLLIGGVALLLSSPLLLKAAMVYDPETLRNTCFLMRSTLA